MGQVIIFTVSLAGRSQGCPSREGLMPPAVHLLDMLRRNRCYPLAVKDGQLTLRGPV